jgi:hypothetical protein
MEEPRVEFLWWRGCPSSEEALAELRAVMSDVGLDGDGVEVREILDEESAEREGCVGSPTIRVDGRDVEAPSESPVGLCCRVYRLRDGRISAIPDPAEVRDALRGAMRGLRDA